MSGPPSLAGIVLDDRYRVLELLGKGGMGYVYEGIQVTLDRRIAIKTLHPKLAHDERARARFLQEAKSASSINHPNVVQIMDFGDTPDESVYFVMEFLDGQDLRALLKREKRLSWARARGILLQCTAALEAAHARDIIHRDIKPGNCFLCDSETGPDGMRVKLLDFGIAKVGTDAEQGDGVEKLTFTGEVFGTATYMAPEQARGEPLDARSDVYSLGIMAYEMLVGRTPFKGSNPLHVMALHLNEIPTPPRSIERSIPLPVEALILRAIAKDPDDRFSSMAELEAAIRDIAPNGRATHRRRRTEQWGSPERPLTMRKPPVVDGPVDVDAPTDVPSGRLVARSRVSSSACTAPTTTPPKALSRPPGGRPRPPAAPPLDRPPTRPRRSTLPADVPVPRKQRATEPAPAPGPLPTHARPGVPPSVLPPRPMAGAHPLSAEASGELRTSTSSGSMPARADGTNPPPGQADDSTSPSAAFAMTSGTGPLAAPSVGDTHPHVARTGPPPSTLRRVSQVLGVAALLTMATAGVTFAVVETKDADPLRHPTTERPLAQTAVPAPAVPKAAVPPTPEPIPVAPAPALAPVAPAPAPPTPASEPSPVEPPPVDPPPIADEPESDDDEILMIEDAPPQPHYLTKPCERVRDKTQAALAGRRWAEVVRLTNLARCWSPEEKSTRRGARVMAFHELGRFKKCVNAGRYERSPQVEVIVARCKEQLDS